MILSFKKISILLIFFTTQSFALTLRPREKSPKNVYQVQRIVGKVKKKELVGTLNKFVKATRPNRFVGSKGHRLTVPWLIEEIKKRDPSGKNMLVVDDFTPDVKYAQDLYLKDFQREVGSKYPTTSPIYHQWKSFTDSMVSIVGQFKNFKGRNVVWEKKGYLNPKDIIVIGAHYDTIANHPRTMKIDSKAQMPGADDNGVAVSMALHLIEVLSEIELPKTVRVVFFDFEELGFLGSRAFVQKYKKELRNEFKTFAYVNLEMLGNDSKSGDKLKKFGNMKVYIRKKGEDGALLDLKAANQLVKAGKKVSSGVNFKIVANSFNSSDHIAFWEEGFPALTFTQDWENDFNKKRYHTPNDFPETVNFDTFYKSFKYIAGAIICWSFDIL